VSGKLREHPAEDWVPVAMAQITFSQIYIKPDDDRFVDWASFVAYAKENPGPTLLDIDPFHRGDYCRQSGARCAASQRQEIAVSVDLHQGLAGRLALNAWKNHCRATAWRSSVEQWPRLESIRLQVGE
jgi:hypothetical protein